MKLFFNPLILCLVFLMSCSFSESERRAAEEKLIADGVLKSESRIKKEKKYNSLITGKWMLDRVYFTVSKELLPYQKEYKKWPDYVTIIEYLNNGSMIETAKYKYSVNNLPSGIQTSEYIYYISDDLLTHNMLGSNKAPTGVSYDYKILKINNDSLIVKSIGGSLNYSPETVKDEDPFIAYYFRIND